jgi:beta-glucosidase
MFRIWQGDAWQIRETAARILVGPASDRLPFTVEIAL